MPRKVVRGFAVSTVYSVLQTAVYPVDEKRPGHCANCYREYSSVEEARLGHEKIIAEIASGRLKPVFVPLEKPEDQPEPSP